MGLIKQMVTQYRSNNIGIMAKWTWLHAVLILYVPTTLLESSHESDHYMDSSMFINIPAEKNGACQQVSLAPFRCIAPQACWGKLLTQICNSCNIERIKSQVVFHRRDYSIIIMFSENTFYPWLRWKEKKCLWIILQSTSYQWWHQFLAHKSALRNPPLFPSTGQ